LSEKGVERRLAAILAADVAGYSRLMGTDEAGTLARLKAHRRELIDPSIAEHKGRIVKTTGDGILIEFSSVVEAVACAGGAACDGGAQRLGSGRPANCIPRRHQSRRYHCRRRRGKVGERGSWNSPCGETNQVEVSVIHETNMRNWQMKPGRNDPCPCGSGKKHKHCDTRLVLSVTRWTARPGRVREISRAQPEPRRDKVCTGVLPRQWRLCRVPTC
jgi:hypothetical protein